MSTYLKIGDDMAMGSSKGLGLKSWVLMLYNNWIICSESILLFWDKTCDSIGTATSVALYEFHIFITNENNGNF